MAPLAVKMKTAHMVRAIKKLTFRTLLFCSTVHSIVRPYRNLNLTLTVRTLRTSYYDM